jgi:hypothetical protein
MEGSHTQQNKSSQPWGCHGCKQAAKRSKLQYIQQQKGPRAAGQLGCRRGPQLAPIIYWGEPRTHTPTPAHPPPPARRTPAARRRGAHAHRTHARTHTRTYELRSSQQLRVASRQSPIAAPSPQPPAPAPAPAPPAPVQPAAPAPHTHTPAARAGHRAAAQAVGAGGGAPCAGWSLACAWGLGPGAPLAC